MSSVFFTRSGQHSQAVPAQRERSSVHVPQQTGSIIIFYPYQIIVSSFPIYTVVLVPYRICDPVDVLKKQPVLELKQRQDRMQQVCIFISVRMIVITCPCTVHHQQLQPTYHPRLGLARVLSRQAEGKPSEECTSLYREVIKISPDVHDAYIELGDLLKQTDPIAAVEVYSSFPFSDPPTFDDAYLHGEIVQLLMTSESYDNPRLSVSMIAMGRALGLAVLEKNVSILEAKFKTPLLKQVYAGVHNKNIDDSELQAFFKFKCWN